MKHALIGFMVASVLTTILLTTHKEAHAGKSCVASFDDCASDEYCYQKSAVSSGVCVKVTFVKQVP